jgi:hypothetical protein
MQVCVVVVAWDLKPWHPQTGSHTVGSGSMFANHVGAVHVVMVIHITDLLLVALRPLATMCCPSWYAIALLNM